MFRQIVTMHCRSHLSTRYFTGTTDIITPKGLAFLSSRTTNWKLDTVNTEFYWLGKVKWFYWGCGCEGVVGISVRFGKNFAVTLPSFHTNICRKLWALWQLVRIFWSYSRGIFQVLKRGRSDVSGMCLLKSLRKHLYEIFKRYWNIFEVLLILFL